MIKMSEEFFKIAVEKLEHLSAWIVDDLPTHGSLSSRMSVIAETVGEVADEISELQGHVHDAGILEAALKEEKSKD